MKDFLKKRLKEEVNNLTNVTLYHGTSADFDDFDVSKSGLVKYSDWGKGIYLTRSKSSAHQYRIDAVKALNKEYNESFAEYENIGKEIKGLKYDSPEYRDAQIRQDDAFNNFRRIGKELNSTKEGRLVVAKLSPNAKVYKYNSYGGMTDPYLADTVKDKGYNVILVDENKWVEEFVVLDTDAIIITGSIKDDI
jgi:hypothetical protein